MRVMTTTIRFAALLFLLAVTYRIVFAILQAEAVIKRPVVVEDAGGDAIAIRSIMNLEVSFDHRILDGGVALRFLNSIKERLEGYTPESRVN